jgi:hypothetical protein
MVVRTAVVYTPPVSESLGFRLVVVASKLLLANTADNPHLVLWMAVGGKSRGAHATTVDTWLRVCQNEKIQTLGSWLGRGLGFRAYG